MEGVNRSISGFLQGLWMAFLVLLCFPSMSFSDDFTAKTIGSYGHIAVMEVSGNYDAKNADATANKIPRQIIAKEFYKTHKDEYDFIVIFSNFDYLMPKPATLAFYTGVKNDTKGIGAELFDYSAFYGSGGKLQGTVDMGNAAALASDTLNPKFENSLDTLSHELMHRWAAFVRFRGADGNPGAALLGEDAMHWSFLLDSRASLMYGNQWQDNSDGTFTSVAIRKYYSPLDLYLMGFIDKTQVPPMLLIENQEINPSRMPELNARITGTARYVTIDDIIAVEGERVPSSADSQKSFKIAFILVTRPGTFTGNELAGVEAMRTEWIKRYSILTDGRGLIDVVLNPKEEIPVSGGFPDPVVTPRPLPANIDDGVQWLMTSQKAEGNWVDLSRTAARDTTETLLALKNFSAAQPNYTRGLQWLADNEITVTDYLARKIEALHAAGRDVGNLLTDLVSRQNTDGGWGGNKTYMSSPVDTSFALGALAAAGYAGQDVIAPAIAYLKSRQNADGGWGNEAGSNIESTANVLRAFNKYRGQYVLDETMKSGQAYLTARQNPDGGFGNSPSTVYDTATAVIALQELNGLTTGVGQGVNFILGLQSADGSWYGSAHQTAMAVSAVWNATVTPDLAIDPQDITFTPNVITGLPASITVNVKISNLGRTNVPEARVVLYDGSVSDAAKIAEQKVAFPGQSTVSLSFPVVISDGNTHKFYISVDADNAVVESNKNNNTAYNILSPSTTYDFEVLSSDISFSQNPVDITKEVAITARISNKGTRNAYNVQVKYYIDEVSGKIDIATATVDIPANTTISSRVVWKTSRAGGNLPITVEVDPGNTFTETSKTNNKAVAALAVNGSVQPNLATSYTDIVITPAVIHEASGVNIRTTVRNEGFAPVAGVTVNFYVGVPGVDGVLIGSQTIPALDAGAGAQVSFDWQNIAVSGEKILYVQVDPNNLFSEITRDDNDAFTTITILSIPDLAISANSITFNPSAPRDGDTVAISVAVKNLGQQPVNSVAVRLSENGAVIGSAVIPAIAGNGQGTATISYSTAGKKGAHEITAEVDPDHLIAERSRDNNVASRTFGVQDANLWLTERYISPNGDAIKDSTDFFFRLSLTQTVKIKVINERGEVVRLFSDDTLANTSGGNITWNGFNDEGMVVADGDYQITIIDAGGNSIGSLTVTVDNNQSPLVKAIGTKYLLNSNLTCMLPDVSWQWFPDESGILAKVSMTNQNAPEYPAGLYFVSADGQDVVRIIPWGAPWDLVTYQSNGYYIRHDISSHGVSPDGNQIFIVLEQKKKSVQWNLYWELVVSQLWVVDRDGRNLKMVHSSDGVSINNPQWSPDSNYLVYTIGENDLWLIKSDGSGDRKIDSADNFYNLKWAPGGTKFAYMRTYDDNSLTVTGINGDKQVIAWSSSDRWNEYEWLNDQKIVGLSLMYAPYYPVWIVDATGAGNHIQLTDRSSQFAISPDKTKIAFTEYAADKTYLKIADGAGNVLSVYESAKSMPYGASANPTELYSTYGTQTIHDIRWSPDAAKLAFYDNAYEKIDDCHYRQYRVLFDVKKKAIRAFPSSTCMDLCYVPEPESYHVQIMEADGWSEKGVLHFGAQFETRKLNLTPYLKGGNGPVRIRLTQKGKDAAHIDYAALAIDGVHYRPSKAVRVSDGEDVLARVAAPDQDTLDAHGATVDLEWETLPSGDQISLVLNANEEAKPDKKRFKQVRKSNRANAVHGNISAGYMACSTIDDGSCANDGGYDNMQWLSDNISLLSSDNGGPFITNSENGNRTYLPVGSVTTVSPFGRYFTYDQTVDSSSVCYGRGYQDTWAMSSLLNLTADLLVKKEKSAVILRGIATDLNFEGYQLEYADAKNPTVWNLVKPPSNVPVVNDVFTTWVPPYEGVFYIKLTVWDKAGNIRWDRKRVTWGLTASITNLYKTQDIFSPNGDSVKDSVELHYTVLEPVHLEFSVLDENNNVIRTYLKDHSTPGEDFISWDGRDAGGKTVPDGKYILKVFDYEFFVEIDNTPPFINLSLGMGQKKYKVDGALVYGPVYGFLSAWATDNNILSAFLERGAGDNPLEWEFRGYLPIDGPAYFEFGISQISEVTGKKFKVTAEDYAGNKKAVVSEYLEERLMLYQWDTWTHASGEVAPYYLGVKSTCRDDFNLKDDFSNLSKCSREEDIPYQSYEEFLAHIAGLPANLSRPGIHALSVMETIRTPLTSVTLQYWNGSKWIDHMITPAPPDGNINLSWDNSGINPEELILVRVKAFGETGIEYYSNIVRIKPLFYLYAPTCEDNQNVYAQNNLYEKLDVLKVQAISGKDPQYLTWTDLVVYRRTGGDTVPEGKFTVTNLPSVKTGMSYRLRMVGTVGEGAGATEIVSNEISYPSNCQDINLWVSYPEAAACNAFSVGKVELSPTIKVSSIKYGTRLISLDYYIQKPEGQQLLRHFDISSELQTEIMRGGSSMLATSLDTSAMAAGSYPVKAILKYFDSQEREISATNAVIVDRTLPVAQITYPGKAQKLCRIQQTTTKGNWFSIPVEAVATDNTFIRGCDPLDFRTCGIHLYYGAGENAEAEIQALSQDKKFAGPIATDDPVKGQLANWDVTGLAGKDYTLKLKVTDIVGNTSCSTVSFSIDSEVDISVISDKRYFSPNNDGVLDDVNISYEISEYATVDVKVYRLIDQGDHNYTLDQTTVRTLAIGKTHLDGTDFETWNGRDDAAAVVPDGLYGVAVHAKDSCGNINTRWVAVEVDNTPPAVNITYPRPSDPLGNIVEIKGTADDLHFQSYTLEVGQGENPDSWMPVAAAANPVKEEAVLGQWNTFGLEGIWTIRLTGKDIVGNQRTASVTVNLTQRKTLIKDLNASPKLFSPNNDGVLDTTGIKYELTDACQVRIEFLDSTGAVRRTHTTSVPSAGVYTYVWDGAGDAGSVLPDGLYTVRITAALSSNTSVTQTEIVTVLLDVTAPTIDLKQPLNDLYLKIRTIPVFGTISDRNIREYASVYTGDGGSGTVDAGNQNRENYTFGTLNELAEGKYTLNVKATDNAGNTAQRDIAFTIDTTPPKVTLDSVKDGEYYGGDKNLVSITGGIVEKNLDEYSLRYGRAEDYPPQWTSLLAGNTVTAASQLYAWKVGKNDGVPDGVYTVSLYARDKAQWTGEARVRIIIDNTLPEASITSLKDGDYVRSAVNINGTAFDANLDNYLLEMSEGQCAGAYKWVAFRKSTSPVKAGLLGLWQIIPADGDYCIRLAATDKVGLRAEAKVQVKVDTTPPAAPALSGRVENKADASISWTKNTEADLAGYNLYRNGVKLNTSLLADIVYADKGLGEGQFKYTVTALDAAGNESKPSNEITLKVDITPPTVRITSPLDGARVSGLVDIKGTAFSSDDFRQYRVSIGRGAAPAAWNVIRTSPVPETFGSLAQWDTIGLTNGVYAIRLEGEDISGNVGTYQINITVDNTPPAATVLLTAVPTGSDVALTWQAVTADDLAGYLVYRNDQLANVAGLVVGNLKPYLITGTSYVDRALPDGKMKYYIVVMDQAGNISDASNTLEVNIDTHAPHITITDPQDKSKFQGKTSLRGESPDLDIAAVQFQYKKAQDAAWINLGAALTKTPFIAGLDPVALGLTYGDYNVRAIATDKANNVDPAPASITLKYTDITAPSAPVDLKALVNGKNVTLTWKANQEVDLNGYNVYRTSAGGSKTRLNGSVVKDATYQDSGLADDTYTYTITALDNYENESPASGGVSATIFAPKLAQPYTPAGNKTILVSGGNGGNGNAVEIFVDSGTGPVSQGTSAADARGAFALSTANLTLGENRITAIAKDGSGNVSRSSDVVYVVYNEAPASPSGLNASVLDHNVTLSWTPNGESDMAGYNLYKNGAKVNEAVSQTSGIATASSSNSYYPPANAFDGNGATQWIAGTDSVSPDSPVWLEIDLPSAELINRLEVNWYAVDDGYGNETVLGGANYEIQFWSGHAWITQTAVTANTSKQNIHAFHPSYRTDKIRIHITGLNGYYYAGITDVKISKDSLITQTGYSDPGLSDGRYRYKLTAVDYDGFESASAEEKEAAIGDVTSPDAPVNLSAGVSGATVTLNWNAATEIDLAGYIVYKKNAESWVRLNVFPVATNNFTDAGLANGSYIYRVTAVDAVGNESLPSNEAQAAVNITPPQAPVSLSVTSAAQGGSLNAAWSYGGDTPAGYNLYRGSTAGGPYSKVNGALIGTNVFLDQNLINGIRYYYVAVAVDAFGNESAYSNEAAGMPLNSTLARPAIHYPTVAGIPVTVSDNITELFGHAEPNTTVELFRNGASLGKSTASAADEAGSISLPSSFYPAVSPDGRMLVYDQNNQVWTMDLTSRNAQQIGEGYPPFSWSPDATRFTYLNYNDNRIMIHDRKTGASSALTSDPDVSEDSVSWSLDGTKVSLVRTKWSDGTYDVWVKNLQSGELRQMTSSGIAWPAAISPDGTRVAYFEDYNLYVVNINTLEVIKIDTETDGNIVNWSPDGQKVAYVSMKNSPAGILIVSVEANQVIKTIASSGNASSPVWSPDGQSMLFRQENSDGKYSILAALLNTDQTSVLCSSLSVNWSYLDWTRSGDIGYFDYARRQLNILVPKGKFHFADVALNDGANIFYAVSTDAAGTASAPSDEITVTCSNKKPDLKVTADDIAVYPPYPKPGEKVSIYANIGNAGAADARNVNVEIYILTGGTWSLLKNESIPLITAGASQAVHLEWSGKAGTGVNMLYVAVDPDDAIPEASEDNNSAFKDIVVMDQTGVEMTTALDAVQYGAMQDVNIGVDIRNSGESQKVTLTAAVEDSNGVPVASLTPVDLRMDYASDQKIPFVWNTASILGGRYRVHAVLKSDQGTIVENIVNFKIVSEIKVDPVMITTDKAVYLADENAEISINITNASRNYILPELTAKIRIANAAGVVVFADEKKVTNLLVGSICNVKDLWNTAASVPGTYQVTLEVYSGEDLVATKLTTFSLAARTAVTGGIAAPGFVLYGNDVKLDYTVRNIGGADVSNLPVRVLIVDPDSQEVLNSFESVVDLPLNVEKSGNCQLSTQGYKLKSYWAVLQALYQGDYKKISSAAFMVKDGTPPVVTILKPFAGTAYASAIDLAVTAADDLSGVAKVEYQIDAGEWKYLPVADAGTGRYSVIWNPVQTDEGAHTISFRATDQAMNTSLAVSTGITINLKPLNPPVINSPSTGSTGVSDTVDIQGTAAPGLAVIMEIQGAARTVQADASTGSFVFTSVALSPGSNSITFFARDQAGKCSDKVSHTLIYLPLKTTVAVNKPAYSINENVEVTAVIANIGASYTINNVTAKLTLFDAGGKTLFTEEKNIAALASGAVQEIKKIWNTSVNPRGIYSVKLQTYSGAGLLSTVTATFEILGTSVTGDGITGSITASPGQVFQGENEVLNYSVGNAGNEDLATVTLKTKVYHSGTLALVGEFADQASIPGAGAIAGSHNVSTSSLLPAVYRAELTAVLPSLAAPKKLATVEFEVKTGVKISKTINTDTANLLVWINNRCLHDDSKVKAKCDEPDSDKPCLRRDLLEKILRESEANYHFVYDRNDFEAAMRNPFYTDFIILGDHEPLEGHHAEELREQVYSGKGLISSLYLKHGNSNDGDYETVFGYRYRGSLPDEYHFIQIPAGSLFDAATLQARGDAARVDAEKPENVQAWIKWKSSYRCHPSPGEYPGIITNVYGLGKTVFFAFDYGASLTAGNYDVMAGILKKAIAYVHNSAAPGHYSSQKYVPVRVRLDNPGDAVDLRVTEKYPAGMEVYDAAAGQWIQDNPWIFNVHLAKDETKDIQYFVFTPDAPGVYTLQTDVDIMENGAYRFYRSVSVTVSVENENAGLAADIITKLNALKAASISDKKLIKSAVEFIRNVQTRRVDSEHDVEKNIMDVLSAVEKITKVRTVDVHNIRLLMDQLLQIWEARSLDQSQREQR